MVTAYSPILKLALPVQGELSGTWGDVVNDNITSMVEQAIAGRAVIDTWTTNSHTLTTANGTTSESRCAMLELTDTGVALTGAGTVICPAASKIYIVKNASGQNITVKTSAGTGILVPNGRTTFLFCDGTNVVEAMTHTTSLQLGTSTVVTAVLDEDNMASDSATSLATQQSIKAYVDSQVGANNELSEVLANGNTTGANDIIVDNGQKITTNTIDETTAGSGVTIDSVLLKDDVVNATDVETGSISANDGTTAATIANSTGVITVPSAVLTTADINGGTADGVVIGSIVPAAATATTVTANTSLNIAGTVTVTSILDEDNMASDDPAGLATQQSIKAYVDAQVGANNELSEVLANGNTTGGNDILFGDNDKAIFGAGSDLQIYHNESNSWIEEVGSGNLNISTNGPSLRLYDGVNSVDMIRAYTGGTVRLYNAGSQKLATTSTGVNVTGTLTIDGGSTSADFTFGDNNKAIFGASSDLQIYHDGSHSVINDVGTGDLKIQGTDIRIQSSNGAENFLVADENGAVRLYNNNSQKLATTSVGVNVTGTLTMDGGSTSADFTFGDNNKAIFGASSDLQIYHNGHSYIEDAGGGDLILKASDQIKLQNGSGQNMAVFNENGAVVLTHSEDTKLATTPTGVDVTGTLTSDELTVDGGVSINSASQSSSTTNQLTLRGGTGNVVAGHVVGGINFDSFDLNNQNTSASISAIASGSHVSGSTLDTDINFKTADGASAVSRLNIGYNGDISFYEDTGTTPKFFWDASAESLGVGTSSPSATLDVSGTIKLDGNYPLGGDNVALGATALNSVESTGKWNVAIGDQALTNNTTGDGNVGIGRQALTTQTTALNNIAIGFQAGYSTTTGGHNVAIGSESFKANTTGISNVAVGRQSLFSSTTAINNVAVGYQAGRAITTGNNNTSVGYQSLLANTTGASNTALGYISLRNNTTGNSNTSLGYASLRLNTTGNQNTAVGYQSLYDNTTGTNNTALGRSALANNTTGTNNTAIGDLAGSAITTGSGNTIIGANIDGTAALADTVIIGSNNAERMRIDSSGNVGIGTTSPAHPLDVTGTIRSDVSTTGDFNFYATSDGGGAFRIYPDDATTANPTWKYQSNSSEDQAWVIGGVERMRIDSVGNVGIATTSPRTKLDIEGNFALDGDSGTTSSTAQTAIATYVADTFKGCKTVITANDGTDTYVTELLIANTGAAAVATEYGQVGTGSFTVSYEVDVSGGNVRILATALNATSTTYKVSKTLM